MRGQAERIAAHEAEAAIEGGELANINADVQARLEADGKPTHIDTGGAVSTDATDARGRFVATPPKPPAASTTKSPSPRSKKAPPSPQEMDLRIFRSPARRQAHPAGRSPRGRASRGSRPWRGS